MIRKGLRPDFRFGLDLDDESVTYRKEYPFRRSWLLIGILATVDLALLYPAATAFQQAVREWSNFESLFDLVGALFITAWLLGWSIAPLLVTLLILVLLFGREVLKVRKGVVEISLGLPLLGLKAEYAVSKMRNLRFVQPPRKSGTAWRGPHFAFDYGANQGEFGSDVPSEDLTEIRNRIHMGEWRSPGPWQGTPGGSGGRVGP